jgi:hypothetical protein
VQEGEDEQNRPGDNRKAPEDTRDCHAPAAAGKRNGDHAKRSQKQFGRQHYNPNCLPRISFMSSSMVRIVSATENCCRARISDLSGLTGIKEIPLVKLNSHP